MKSIIPPWKCLSVWEIFALKEVPCIGLLSTHHGNQWMPRFDICQIKLEHSQPVGQGLVWVAMADRSQHQRRHKGQLTAHVCCQEGLYEVITSEPIPTRVVDLAERHTVCFSQKQRKDSMKTPFSVYQLLRSSTKAESDVHGDPSSLCNCLHLSHL